MSIPYLREIIIAVLIIGAMSLYFEGRRNGYQACEMKYLKAVTQRDAAMEKLKAQHAAILNDFQTRLSAVRREDEVKLKQYMQHDISLQVWWSAPVPAAAADFAWGVQHSSDDRAVSR